MFRHRDSGSREDPDRSEGHNPRPVAFHGADRTVQGMNVCFGEPGPRRPDNLYGPRLPQMPTVLPGPGTPRPHGLFPTTDGPWVQAFVVDVPFAVRSKSNFRRGGTGTDARAQWKAHQAFEAELRQLFRAELPAGWEVAADLPLPQRPVIVVAIRAVTMLDTGNVSKSILDAVEGVVYRNDAQVRAELTVTERSRHEQAARIGFARLTPGTTGAPVTAAVVALAALVDARSVRRIGDIGVPGTEGW